MPGKRPGVPLSRALAVSAAALFAAFLGGLGLSLEFTDNPCIGLGLWAFLPGCLFRYGSANRAPFKNWALLAAGLCERYLARTPSPRASVSRSTATADPMHTPIQLAAPSRSFWSSLIANWFLGFRFVRGSFHTCKPGGGRSAARLA